MEIFQFKPEQNNRKRTTFEFPSGIEQGTTFNSVQEIFALVKSSELKAGSPLIKDLYRILYEPHRTNFKYLRLHCKFCTANISFVVQDDKRIMASKVNTSHEHTIAKQHRFCKEEFEKQLKTFSQEQSANRPTFALSDQTHNSFVQIQQWLGANNFEVRYDWQEEPRDKFPRQFVIVSPRMKANYARYGDLVSFDITYSLIKNVASDARRYNVGIFTIQDTNLRILFAGIAFICDQSAESFYSLFNHFYNIHGKWPQTFITDQQPAISASLKIHSQKGSFKGMHILDTWHVVKNIITKLGYTKQEGHQFSKVLSKAILTRDRQQFQRLYSIIQQNQRLRQSHSGFLQHYQKIFYCRMPPKFVSIRRSNCQKINDLIKERVPVEVRFASFINGIHLLDQTLTFKSESKFSFCDQKLEILFEDSRLEAVRENYQRKIVDRFMENYFTAIKEYKVKRQFTNKKTLQPAFTVQRNGYGTEDVVTNWSCPCAQLQKTGVSCPHLLAVAIIHPQKPYTELINRRFRISQKKSEGIQCFIKQEKIVQETEKRNYTRRKCRVIC